MSGETLPDTAQILSRYVDVPSPCASASTAT